MQLNYFTVSHDIIFLFGSSGDIKLSFGAKVDFSGWVVLFHTPLCWSMGKSEMFLIGPKDTLKDKPSFDLFLKKLKGHQAILCYIPKTGDTSLIFFFFKLCCGPASLTERNIPC